MNRPEVFSLFILCALGTMALASADTFIRTQHHTEAFEMMGTQVPAADKQIVSWIGADRMRVEVAGDTVVLIDMASKSMTIIERTTKTFRTLPMGDINALMKQAMAESGMSEENSEAMGPMMEQMIQGMMGQFSAAVTCAGEKRKVGKWQCTKYMVRMTIPMGESTSEMWVTKDVKIDPSMVLRMRHAQLLSHPGFDSMMEELKKIDGMPVLSTTRMKVMSSDIVSTDKVVEIAEKKAPAGTYDVPAGYREMK